MSETTPLIKAALNLRVGAGFDVYLIFKILNPYPYIKYEEMNTWFDLEHSSKGAKHGLGLYYVKQICQKYRANIICRNVECQGKNWIEMNLEIEKANR